MALVVLFSTFSFTVDQHYCGDILVDYSFFGKAQACGMEIQQATDSQENKLEKKGCCDDETLLIMGQNDLKLSHDTLSFEQQQFVVSFVYTYINLFEGFENKVSSYSKYPPPLIVKRIYKLDETYLI